MSTILLHAAELFDVGIKAICGRGRSNRLVEARQAVCYAARRRGWSLCEIARAVNRDHSTVMFAIGAAERRAVTDVDYAQRLAALL